MAVERLFDIHTIFDVKDFGWEENRVMSNSEKLYRKLQDSPLYDRQGEQWFMSLKEDQTLGSDHLKGDTQLIGVLVEALFDPENARRLCEKVKETHFIDEHSKRRYMLQKNWPFPERDTGTAGDQLLTVLADGLFDKQKAIERYDAVKRTRIYDRLRGQWLHNSFQGISFRAAGDQLLGVWVESLLDKGKALKRYEKLKKTSLYDKDTKEWLSTISKWQRLENDSRKITNQLLGVIVEGIFDTRTAWERFERLKQSEHYDSENKQWLSSFRGEVVRDSDDQLLGVYLEHMFEKEYGVISEEMPVALPEVRRF